MIRAKVWRTADGRDFNDRAQAKRHEAWLELEDTMRGVAAVYCGGTVPEKRAAEMALFILSRTTDLQRLLRAKPCEGGKDGEG